MPCLESYLFLAGEMIELISGSLDLRVSFADGD